MNSYSYNSEKDRIVLDYIKTNMLNRYITINNKNFHFTNSFNHKLDYLDIMCIYNSGNVVWLESFGYNSKRFIQLGEVTDDTLYLGIRNEKINNFLL